MTATWPISTCPRCGTRHAIAPHGRLVPHGSCIDVIPTIHLLTQRLIDLFDAAAATNADVSIWEHAVPGAHAALVAWAESHGLPCRAPIQVDATCTVTRVAPRGETNADIRVYVRTGTP